MIDKNRVQEIVAAYFPVSDLYLVDIRVEPGNRIVVEIDSDSSVSIDDCADLTRYIESHFDRDAEDYELEVGSAGISQAFKILRQYTKNIGREVEILTKAGKKMFGVLKAANEKNLVITCSKQVKPEGAKRKVTVNEEITFAYDELKYTKCVIKI